jgi:hypothetical protein
MDEDAEIVSSNMNVYNYRLELIDRTAERKERKSGDARTPISLFRSRFEVKVSI